MEVEQGIFSRVLPVTLWSPGGRKRRVNEAFTIEPWTVIRQIKSMEASSGGEVVEGEQMEGHSILCLLADEWS